MFQDARSDGGGADYQRAIGHGFGDRRILAGLFQDGVRLHGGAGFTDSNVVWIHQTELGESEIAHGAGGGSDVQRIARGDQNDFERAHGVCG